MKPLSPQRKNLVLVRAGDGSLHQEWLGFSYGVRDFDVVVSYYSRDAYSRHVVEDGVWAHFCPGGKWEGLYQTLAWIGDALKSYDFVWLPDDDIETSAQSVNTLFELMRRYELSVGQPSLTADSYFTHFIFVNCPGIKVRWSNYIEIMVPCLARDLLLAVLPHFKESMSGFGLDYIWCRLPATGERGAAIIDAVQVRHTRPVGQVLLSKMSERGLSPKEEQAKLDAVFGITEPVTPLVYGLRTITGRNVFGLRRVCWPMVWGHLKLVLRIPPRGRRYGLGRIHQLVRRQLNRKCDLSVLPSERG
ncbi:hypothetical protein [Ciceribacter sp. RN22]|uniref:hypothetical protein n=1 Tax=Ciceribacter sp. RN22 TaxID=2954932 RepID=UPI0020921F02|nr:hypothetical protein [Ciceribacter sp. RN22]MCO6181105.1 hypothetical protein [Ciceribacter sp. RN22]